MHFEAKIVAWPAMFKQSFAIQMNFDLLGSCSISGLVVEYIVAIDVTGVRFPADAL